MSNSSKYSTIADEYIAQLRNLFDVPKERVSPAQVERGERAGTLPINVLTERTEQLSETSKRLTEATAYDLKAETQHQREVAEVRLLAQALANLKASQELLETAEQVSEGEVVTGKENITRSAAVQHSTVQLAEQLEAIFATDPLEAAIGGLRGTKARPQNLEEAKSGLLESIESSLDAICDRASTVGGKAVRDLVFMDASALAQGAALISKEAADLIDKLVSELTGLLLRLVKAALGLLLQTYACVATLLGKKVAQQARLQVAGWLEELRKESPEGEEPNLSEVLVNRLYAPEVIQTEAKDWLQVTPVEVIQLNQVAETVEAIAKKYRAKTVQVDDLLKGLVFVRQIPILKTPQGQTITAAVTLGLLGYVLYTGYDHVRNGRITFSPRFSFDIPDRVEGIREVLQKVLVTA
jgi:hypothetical protein